MAIQFKFRSSAKFDSLDIEGRPFISIGDLKSRIINLKNLDTCHFDLVFSDARTGQDFVDDKIRIPSGSCVIIKRVPVGSVPANVVHHRLVGNFEAKDTKMVDSSHRLNTEMDDFDDFGVDLYPFDKANSSISQNNTNINAIRRYNEKERGYLEPEGSGFSEAIQGDSNHGAIGGTVLPKNSKLNTDEGIGLEKPVFATPSAILNCEIPLELKCALCNSFFVDAVIIRCCQQSFCEKCIHRVLLEKAKCPLCGSTKYKVEDLLPNLSLRQTVAHFLILTGDSDNAHDHSAPDEESRVEGNEMPSFSYATGRGANQDMMDFIPDSSFRRNMKIKVDKAELGSCHPQNFGVRPEDLPPFDDCQGESQPVFGDVKPGLPNASGRNHNIADFRRQKRRDRTCYMCGSLDHFIRDCPAASNSHPMHQMGVMPGYASPWHHVSPFLNLYSSPMAYNTLIMPDANSYWASIYGGYPVPSGFMMMGGMTAPQLGKSEGFCPGYSELVDVNACNRKRKISNNHMRVKSFTNEDGGEREDDEAKKKDQHNRDGRSRRDHGMLEEREHQCGREDAEDERHRLKDRTRKSSNSSRDEKLNRVDGRLSSDVEDLPCSTNFQTKVRSGGHHHRCSREIGGRTDGCCGASSLNHHERFKQKDFKFNGVEADWKGHTQKHHNHSDCGLEQSFPSDQKSLQNETLFISRCSKHNTRYTRDELTRDHWQIDGRSNENCEECNRKHEGKRFVKRNYRSEF